MEVAAGFVSAAAVLIAAITAGYKVWSRARAERDASALGQYREIADRLQREIERRDAHIRELDEQNEQLWEERSDCEADLSAVHGYLELLWRHLRSGGDLGHLPEPPARRPRPGRAQAEFRRRTASQATQLLTGEGPPPPAPLSGEDER